MSAASFRAFSPRRALPLGEIPLLPWDALRNQVVAAGEEGKSLAGLLLLPGSRRLTALLTHDQEGECSIGCCEVGGSYPSLTPYLRQAHRLERELFEATGIVPLGHPHLDPVRYPPPREGERPLPGSAAPFRVEGEEIHEVAVGPVHAGVIEPGHFRFQCHGEHVFALSISLGFQHRGVEAALIGGPGPRTVHLMETLAGDTSVGHATAYAQAVETLAGQGPAPRGADIRSLGLELERLANHVGDLGALAGDVAFLSTSSFCGRLRGDLLNLTALVCGSRLGRGLARPGGAGFDVPPAMAEEMGSRLGTIMKDVRGAVELMRGAHSVSARFENTGSVHRDTARELGLVGPAARACGLERDVRADFPTDAFTRLPVRAAARFHGDVASRAEVRWQEVRASAEWVGKALADLSPGPALAPLPPLAPRSLSVALVEGWRGRICHLAVTGDDGRFAAYRVWDPSFFNWTGLAMALRGAEISDFPLINKSFNLSYCGHDL